MERPQAAPPELRHSALRLVLLCAALALVGSGWAALRWADGRSELAPLDRVSAPEAPAESIGRLAPPLAAPTPQSTETVSERSVVAVAPAGSPRALHATIELFVVDAETDLPLQDVSVRALSVAVTAKPNEARELDAGWVLSPPLGEQPGPHVAALPVLASGASPLACPTELGEELWITARGYGWARLSLFEAWPDRITVRLQRGAILEVTVPNDDDYSRLLVVLKPKAREAGRRSQPIRRTALDGSAYYSGLRSGDYELEVTGFPVRGGELERKSRTITLRDREHRRELLSLEMHYGELALRFVEPVEAQGGPALESLWIESLGPDVRANVRTRGIDGFDKSRDTSGAVASISTKTLRLPAGKTRITVEPHGVQYELDVLAGMSVTLDRELPRLYRRRIVFWDTRRDAAWSGAASAYRDAPLEQGVARRPLLSGRLGEESGAIDTFWPAVPFYLTFGFPPERPSPQIMRYGSGADLRDGQRIELQSPEEWGELEEFESLLRRDR